MKKLLITAAVFVCASIGAAHAEMLHESLSSYTARQAEMRQEVKPEVNNACARKWGTNYDMQLYCRTKQMAAYELFIDTMKRLIVLSDNPATEESARIWHEIISDCANKWIGDFQFDMVNYCIGKQTSAYNQLQKQH